MRAADMQHVLLSTYCHLLPLSAAHTVAACLYDAALLTPLLLQLLLITATQDKQVPLGDYICLLECSCTGSVMYKQLLTYPAPSR
jgi:hypothetical protein